MTIKLSTNIKEIGKSLDTTHSKPDILILFGNEAPDGLREYCIIIDNHELSQDLCVGDKFRINNTKFTITAIGANVNYQLKEIGHVTLYFNGSNEAEQSGSIYLEHKTIPNITIGTTLTFLQNKN